MTHIENINTDLLRFSTMGSVDDGKSTLIGRLLFDSKSIFEDQIEQVKSASKSRGRGEFDLSLLTDGLRAEREQGITIDVAYRYFRTPKRSFIIADTPGHAQYTRNMVTGASTTQVALVLIDARYGLLEQSKRHLYLASLLRIRHVVICINKMDLVEWSEARFEELICEIEAFTDKTDITDVTCIPMSALDGDNVVDRSKNMPWYNGPTVLHHLEHMHVSSDAPHSFVRLPVQYVVRDHKADYRGYAGRLVAGNLKTGQELTVARTGQTALVAGVDFDGTDIGEAHPGQSVTVRMDTEIDIARGDMLVTTNTPPQSGMQVKCNLCWMNDAPLNPSGLYWLNIGTQSVKCRVQEVHHVVDVNSLEPQTEQSHMKMNDIALVTLQTTTPVLFDSYHVSQQTGNLILVDPVTHNTVAAGMIY